MMDCKTKYMPVWGRHMAVLDKLPAQELGELVRAMMHYHFEGAEPELTGILGVYWDFVKPDLDNARENYEKKAERGRKGGIRSGEVRREKKENEAKESTSKQSQAKESTTKQNEQIESESEIESKTESKTESESETESKAESDTGSAPADAGICVEKKAYGEFGWVKLADKQYRSLQAKMGEQTLRKCIRYIDRAAQSTENRNRWKDWYLMVLRCYENGWYQQRSTASYGKPSIPQGASGQLGEAELEAIRRVLAE